ncbi:MAG: hypothetical protein HC811_11335 [Flammeovirgaceae bacterium]|nr:hypothetical protein [Flammeovirgaceae bacterium]
MIVWSCDPVESENTTDENPPCEGFDLANSDPAAIELADSVMRAMGGRKNWDNTRFISWNFGRRDLVWDKMEGRVRIESLRDSTTYLVNIHDGTGRVQIRGQEITEPDSLQKLLTRAKNIWINDSYWLVMPFKLKDTGVTLKYLGEDTVSNERFNILELTFREVGVTPQNKYRVMVSVKENLVKRWSYYENANQDSANWNNPFDNYQNYGNILLSADRSDNRGPKNVRVDESLPDEVFTTF